MIFSKLFLSNFAQVGLERPIQNVLVTISTKIAMDELSVKNSADFVQIVVKCYY